MYQKQYKSATHTQHLPVLRSKMMRVSDGANLGDGLSYSQEMVLDDAYALTDDADIQRLSIVAATNGQFHVADDSFQGTRGRQLFLDCVATFMPPSGDTIEVLILVEVDEDNNIAEIYGAPLAPFSPKIDYVLVGIDHQNAPMRLAQLACVSFTRGTRITAASGEQKKVEDLRVGDRILTRDDGPQEIRWIGHSTQRAKGEFAPIMITAGTLNNSADLKVCPDHRLFIYQRHDHIGIGRSQLLVKARHLVNGETVTVQEGGFVDYFQLMFDKHQIIFAEGIAAETMQIDTRTRGILPNDLKASVAEHEHQHHQNYEVHESLLDRPNAAALLKRASSK